MKGEIIVGIADIGAGEGDDLLTTIGLGSCIGVVFYDLKSHFATMGHFMLPDSTIKRRDQPLKPEKYGDTCMSKMLELMLDRGSKKRDIQAKAAGGASMFKMITKSGINDISSKNIKSLHRNIEELGIRLIDQDVGGTKGRTITFNISNGDLSIKMVNHELSGLNRYQLKVI